MGDRLEGSDAMGCTKHFMKVVWEHHAWHPRVSSSEILTSQETNMWARVVYRDYVRCDKQDVCSVCGTVRRQESCMCDMERAERCALRSAWMAESSRPTA
ncbi:MAG: hypothetical protein OEW19_09125 [Acidobacteriota bacterium]|jgi:hypothetical protein|nr:hypothetical protein [Acidobacteriota bacterium]